MVKGIFAKRLGITARSALTNIVLVTSTFVWYYVALDILLDIVKQMALDNFTTLLIWSSHFAGIILSAVAGALLTKRMGGRVRFLILWMILGVLCSFISVVVKIADTATVLALSFLFGASLGLGMPNCMGYFTRSVNIEKRGRFAGMIILFSGLGMALLGITAIENIQLQSLILALWRASSLAIFLLIKPPEEMKTENKDPPYRFIFGQRHFILYLVPWIMFSLVNYLSASVQLSFVGSSMLQLLMVIENALLGVSAIVGGFLSDYIGRKRIAVAGFVMLGLGFSVLGLYPENSVSWYFYIIVDAIAWGIFYVIFVVTIWGDLSHGTASDKYYAVGVMPFFISKFLQLVIGNFIADTISNMYALFSFTAFFLFLAVLPLMYAPETLPEKTIKDRELKNYIEKAQKEATKAQKKEAKNEKRENEDAEVEIEANKKDFEEVLKEAEKYY
jgi:MFS family permease